MELGFSPGCVIVKYMYSFISQSTGPHVARSRLSTVPQVHVAYEDQWHVSILITTKVPLNEKQKCSSIASYYSLQSVLSLAFLPSLEHPFQNSAISRTMQSSRGPQLIIHPETYRPTRMTPAATSFWILDRTLAFFMCSCRAAGSDCACWRMACMTGSCMMLMICAKFVLAKIRTRQRNRLMDPGWGFGDTGG